MVMSAYGVTWDVPWGKWSNGAGEYSISSNGGGHNRLPSYFNWNQGVPQSSSDLNTGVQETWTEQFDTNGSSWITYDAAAGGGKSSNGLFNNAHAIITHGLDQISGVSFGQQSIESTTFRNFTPNGYGTITVSADFSGLLDWLTNPNYDWEWGDAINPPGFWSDFQVHGNVKILPFIQDGGVIGGIDDEINFNLDANTPTGSVLMQGSFSFDPVMNPEIYYVLMSTLTIETRCQNLDMGNWDIGELPAPLTIGSLTLDATVTQAPVPIPGSIVLLGSALAGLGLIRRRRSKQ